jgi:5-methylthioadenosine/S-adenosylhomocysteine deaminase
VSRSGFLGGILVHVYTVRFVLPVVSRPILDGAVAVEGDRVTAVGPREEVLAAAGDKAEVRDLGSAAVMPGLVNCHTHLELSWLEEDPPRGGDYEVWLRDLLDRRPREDPNQARAAAAQALTLLSARGTVAVGDVSNGIWCGPLIAKAGFHGVLFHELLGLKATEAEASLEAAATRLEELTADADVAAARDRIRVVLTPHAPHTTSAPLLRALAGRAAAANQPLSIHVAESEAEVDLLQDGSGPLGALFDELDLRDPSWSPPGLTPVAHLDRLGVLSPRTLAVHCVRLRRTDHSLLQARRATVIACARSNERLGVGRAPLVELLREGIPVALGTDSLASAPDLDLLAEIVALRRIWPALKPAAILRMATLNGARALGLDTCLGSVEAGKLARLLVVPVAAEEDDPLEVVCSNPPTVFPLAEAPWSGAS